MLTWDSWHELEKDIPSGHRKIPFSLWKKSIREAGCQRACAVSILGSFKNHLYRALNDLVWSLTLLCFVQRLGKITSWDSFHFEFSGCLLTKTIFLGSPRPAARHLHYCRFTSAWSPYQWCSATLKTSLCYQHCSRNKSKSQHDTRSCEKSYHFPSQTQHKTCKKSQQNAEATYNLHVYHNYDHPWALCVLSFLPNISLIFPLNKVLDGV